MLRSPCPKCREPMPVGAPKCRDCSYRLTTAEARAARHVAGLKLGTTGIVIGTLIYVIGLR